MHCKPTVIEPHYEVLTIFEQTEGHSGNPKNLNNLVAQITLSSEYWTNIPDSGKCGGWEPRDLGSQAGVTN